MAALARSTPRSCAPGWPSQGQRSVFTRSPRERAPSRHKGVGVSVGEREYPSINHININSLNPALVSHGGDQQQQTPADREEGGGVGKDGTRLGGGLGVAPRTHDEIKPPRAGFRQGDLISSARHVAYRRPSPSSFGRDALMFLFFIDGSNHLA